MEEISAAAHSLALFRPLQPRAKWAVVQCSIVGQRAHVVLSSYSLAATVAHTRIHSAVLRTPHSFAARVYRLVPPHSFTQSHTRSSQADHTIRRHTLTSKFTLGNNHHRGRCLSIVRYLFLGTFRHLHLSLIGSHCCCRQSWPDLHPDAIAHS